MLDEVLDLEDRIALGHQAGTSSAIRPPTSRRVFLSVGSSQQRSAWPFALGRRSSSAGSSEHFSKACGQRGAKRPPGGSGSREGGGPPIWDSRSARSSSSRAIEPSK